MVGRLFIAVFAAFFIFTVAHYYLYMRLVAPFVGLYNHLWVGVFLGLWSLVFFGFIILRILPHFLRKIFELIMFTWMGASFIFFVICILSMPLHVIFIYNVLDEMYLSAFVLCSGTCVVLYSIYNALKMPSLIPVDIPLRPEDPREMESLVCVVIGDVHVSGLIGKRRMKKIVDLIDGVAPDIIFITGDLMDGSLRQLKKEIEPLRHLKASMKIIYITGNHEYYSGPVHWKNYFEKEFRWHILRNEAVLLEKNGVRIHVLGIEDKHWLSYERISRKQDNRMQIAVEDLDRKDFEPNRSQSSAFHILLAHQPKDAHFLTQYPWIRLQISGHTHGGQVWPFHYFVLKDQKYNRGLYQVNQKQWLYVNQGTGFWGPPMRLGTSGEITVMRFRFSP
jgi:predicted MPP superfamily phosphohydrolase